MLYRNVWSLPQSQFGHVPCKMIAHSLFSPAPMGPSALALLVRPLPILQSRTAPATFSTKQLSLLLFQCCFRSPLGRDGTDVWAWALCWEDQRSTPAYTHLPPSKVASGMEEMCLSLAHCAPATPVPKPSLTEHSKCSPPCCHLLSPLHRMLSPKIHGAYSLIPSEHSSKVHSLEVFPAILHSLTLLCFVSLV